VSDVVEEDHRLRMRVSGSMAPLLQAAGRHELLDFVSREPSLEEAFLAEYGQRAAEAVAAVPAGKESGRDS
jgi:ABC-2 type transport system ATP-binding protein